MRYERSLCHAQARREKPQRTPMQRRFRCDHFVTPALWTSLGNSAVIHDQFVTPSAITLSRVGPQTHDHFVTHSYS